MINVFLFPDYLYTIINCLPNYLFPNH